MVVQSQCRAIKNKALAYLSMLKDPAVTADILKRFRGATNMTDKIAMLAALSDTPSEAPFVMSPDMHPPQSQHTCLLRNRELVAWVQIQQLNMARSRTLEIALTAPLPWF